MKRSVGFASDNQASVHPAALAAIAAVNDGHVPSYGHDAHTARLQEIFRAHFGPAAQAHPVFNGTAANVLCLEALTEPWEGVVCARSSHLNVDECGAPERAGRKLLVVDTPDGKLTPEAVAPLITRAGDEHVVQPRVVSITQSTELGTLYRPEEMAALADWAHERGLLLHVDGARIANAAAALDVPLRAITTDAGADALSFGGTKNGLLGAEAVVLLREELGAGFRFRRKQAMQLASKMRFVSAQLEALLTDDLWRETAGHANAMAQRLAAAIGDLDGVRFTQPVQVNSLFVVVDPEVSARLQREWDFYVWTEHTGEVRWMTAWDTRPEDVDAFAAAIRAELSR